MGTSRKVASLVAASGLAATALALAPQSGSAAMTTLAGDGRQVLTDFSFSHTAYGSRTTGNPNAESGATALSHLPCTRAVPRSNENFVATAGDGDGTELDNVRSQGFTKKVRGTVSVTSQNTIERGSLASGAIEFTNLRAVAKTLHDGNGFATKTVSSLGSLTISGAPIIPVPDAERQEIPVPGVGTLILNMKKSSEGMRTAKAGVNVIRFEGDDGTVTRVGKAYSRMDKGVTGGVFGGAAWGSEARVGDVAAAGRSALKPIPCPGTNGKVQTNATGEGRFDFGFIGARRSFVLGDQMGDKAFGYTRNHTDSAKFGAGALIFRNIEAKANVRRQADGDLVRNAKGTGIGRIVVNGEEMVLPPPGEPQQVPGLGTFTFKKVDKTPTGIDVTALTVRLFNGSEADTVVELGRAKLNIRKK
jgi:hypothetical protein